MSIEVLILGIFIGVILALLLRPPHHNYGTGISTSYSKTSFLRCEHNAPIIATKFGKKVPKTMNNLSDVYTLMICEECFKEGENKLFFAPPKP